MSSEPSLKERAREELRNYAFVAAYLYVCFGAILFYKTALFFLLLIALSVIEELVVGRVHGSSLTASVAGLRAHAGLEMLATSLLMLLVLVPLISFKEPRRRNLV